jgi:hypothetical protein
MQMMTKKKRQDAAINGPFLRQLKWNDPPAHIKMQSCVSEIAN